MGTNTELDSTKLCYSKKLGLKAAGHNLPLINLVTDFV